MLHKIVETGKTDDWCNNLVKHVTKIIFFFLCQTRLDMLITTVGIITIGADMLGTIFGIEIVKKNFSFQLKDQ